MHGGAEGVEGGSDTVTWWRDTLCAAAKRLQGCARGVERAKRPHVRLMSRAAIAAVAGLVIIACATSAGLGPCPKRCYTNGRLHPEMRACVACLPPSDLSLRFVGLRGDLMISDALANADW